jgi:uncharacterized protein
MLKRPWMQTLLRWTGRSEFALETVETTLQATDAGNVDIALLSAWYGPEGCLISNEEVARMVAAAPTRFRGLASVDLERPMEAVREIRRWADRTAFLRRNALRVFGLQSMVDLRLTPHEGLYPA